ncbi:MAG: methyltransferase domain-containing protein [Spirochaetota bacterium]
MLKIKAEKWVHNGYCIAHSEGKTYFVSGAIPGETVLCEESFRKSGFSHLQTKQVLDASPERIESDCKYFGTCGGCSFRHINYDTELQVKVRLLQEALQFNSIPQMQSTEPNHYRNTVQLKSQNNKIGFFQAHSQQLVSIQDYGCKLLAPEINAHIQKLQPPYAKELKLRFNGKKVNKYNKQETTFTIQDKQIQIPANGFFQVNRYLINDWLEHIKASVPEKAAVLELFCGSGLISLAIADKVTSLVGYELNPAAIAYARKNARKQQYSHLKFHIWDLYKSSLPKRQKSLQYWLCNPPRNGLGKQIIKIIEEKKPNHLLYSSCNYSTLARDWKLLQSYGYGISNIQAFDFFPRTPHFETLCLFELK